MVAQHKTPDGTPKRLSPAVEARLSAALRPVVTKGEWNDEDLTTAIDAAVADAKTLGLQPVELLLVLKYIERQLFNEVGYIGEKAARLRTRIIEALLTAYYR